MKIRHIKVDGYYYSEDDGENDAYFFYKCKITSLENGTYEIRYSLYQSHYEHDHMFVAYPSGIELINYHYEEEETEAREGFSHPLDFTQVILDEAIEAAKTHKKANKIISKSKKKIKKLKKKCRKDLNKLNLNIE